MPDVDQESLVFLTICFLFFHRVITELNSWKIKTESKDCSERLMLMDLIVLLGMIYSLMSLYDM